MPHAWLPPSLIRQPFSSACLNAASISLSGGTLRNISPPINGHHDPVVKRQPNHAVLVVAQAQTTVCSTHRTRSPARASSPRVRGTPFHRHARNLNTRFIPACAGNTHRCDASERTKSVHPRVCGEHTGRPSTVCNERGSSPRVRGTHLERDVVRLRERFIPACAGNTRRGDLQDPR